MNPYAGATPWVHPTNPPPPAPAPPSGDPAGRLHADQIDPFAEGPHYGPVLEPFLAKVVGASIRLNPLLAPPSDLQEDYLRWNMLFHTSNCYRTTESRRSWIKGRKAPATHPRLSHIRLVSRSFPWMIHVRARDPRIGVTCGEVLDSISSYLHGDVAKKEYESVSPHKKRVIWTAYQHHRSTDPNVPGGGLGESLKRLDWLGLDSRFGGVVINSGIVRELCGDVLPCTFELKCLPSYPLTPQELREQQQRASHASRGSSRSRSSPPATTSGGSVEEE
ncbi:hypothetical protein F5I97DRAFT_1800824 [Phlebopus sp. FC_14]|nr:hypothetical protein F5I97DRAFT_1800824 [Phlebopus sp. FC_14]